MDRIDHGDTVNSDNMDWCKLFATSLIERASMDDETFKTSYCASMANSQIDVSHSRLMKMYALCEESKQRTR